MELDWPVYKLYAQYVPVYKVHVCTHGAVCALPVYKVYAYSCIHTVCMYVHLVPEWGGGVCGQDNFVRTGYNHMCKYVHGPDRIPLAM